METRQVILTGVFKLFAEKGLTFSMNDVAEYVGIKKASIYAHFPSKEAILKEVIERESEGYFLLNSTAKDLKTIFFDILAYHQQDKTRALFWKRLLILPQKSMDQLVMDQIQNRLEDRFLLVQNIINNELNQGEAVNSAIETLTVMYFSLIHGLLSSELIYNTKDMNVMYEDIWRQFEKNMISSK